ncbi:MAG: phosphatidylserine decarboxylase [Verrucomicrobia bacterium]|nr:phosphatidylserine decarboxylase [Verrucomicrobiota bacterium]
MTDIFYYDRLSKKEEKEKVYGHFFLKILYGNGILSRFFSLFLLPIFSKIPFLSRLYGAYQKSPISKHKVKPFIRSFEVDASEFLDPVDSFASFNDFFIRRLKPESRPMVSGNDVAALPADARYLVFPNIEKADGFWVKGKKFSLKELLQSEELAARYAQGAMVMARLCPVDYHRFHFPFQCTPGKAKLINGPLFSVNPMALKRNIEFLSENKRMMTELETRNFGKAIYLEVGATYVGCIEQTYTPGEPYAKGEEKGYFAFGGSCLILLFEPGRIEFDQDLIEHSSRKMEVRGLLGQSLGRALAPGLKSS